MRRFVGLSYRMRWPSSSARIAAIASVAWTSAKWTCRSRSAAVRRVRLEKLNHAEAVEPRRDALIADELEG
jgi:hypothetical protein